MKPNDAEMQENICRMAAPLAEFLSGQMGALWELQMNQNRVVVLDKQQDYGFCLFFNGIPTKHQDSHPE